MRFTLLLGFSETRNKTKILFSWGGSVLLLVVKREIVKNNYRKKYFKKLTILLSLS